MMLLTVYGINHCLDWILVPRGIIIGDGPARFFANTLLGEERRVRRQGRAFLLMIDNVPDRAKDGGRSVEYSSTRRRQTPASMTAWVFSLGPSLI